MTGAVFLRMGCASLVDSCVATDTFDPTIQPGTIGAVTLGKRAMASFGHFFFGSRSPWIRRGFVSQFYFGDRNS
jgi:hypothetical protein